MSFKDNETQFEAFASEPLEIENRSLGYHVTFVLDYFLYNKSEDKTYTRGTWYFEELIPESEEQLFKWKTDVKVAFKGSLQHLLWAMVNERIEKEGFSILRDNNVEGDAPELFLHRYHPVNISEVIKSTDVDYEFEMTFDDFIRVYYLRTGDKGRLFKKVTIPSEQLSYLKSTGEKITIHESGYMYGSRIEAGNLLVYGHLARLGVADLLPQELRID